MTTSVLTNTFCASGMHLPNGSWATFGGNAAISVGTDLVLRSQYALNPFFLWKKGVGHLLPRFMTTSTATTMAESPSVYSTRAPKPTCPPKPVSGSTTPPCSSCRICADTPLQKHSPTAPLCSSGASRWVATSIGTCPTPILRTKVAARRRRTSFTPAGVPPRP